MITSVAAIAAAISFLVLGRLLGLRENPLLEYVLPRTTSDRAWFVLVSLSAGIGEETVFRAFLIPALTAVLGSGWIAAAPSAIAFGVFHSYQGLSGAVRAGLLGYLLAVPFLLTGSVYPSMIAHAAYDLIAGLLLADWLVGRRNT